MTTQLQVNEVNELNSDVLEELTQLLIDVVADGASIGFLPPLSREEAVSYWQGVLAPDVLLWIAREGGRVCGAIQLHLAMKANALHRAEVAKLMVHPGQRRKGIGRVLMHTVEQKALELDRHLLILDTREGDPSNTLYRSVGYTEAGRIPRFARSADGSLDGTVYYFKEI